MARSDPPSARIAAEYRRRIEAGVLRPGDRMPSTRQLTRDWGVAIATATKVLAALRDAGLIQAIPGVGSVVLTAPVPRPPGSADERAAERAGARTERADARAEDRADVRAKRAEDRAASRAERRREHADPVEPELRRDRIVLAAVAIADDEGIAAVSMRRIAADLGVATMSLYRHVPGKDELTNLMVDEVMGRYRLPEPPPAGWRAQLELVTRLHWRIYRKHPWIAPLLSFTRPQPILNGMAHTEWAMRALSETPLDAAARMHLVVMVFGFVNGLGGHLDKEVEEEQNTGLTSEEWMQTQDETYAAIFNGRFPELGRLAENPNFDLPLEALFETGLKLILDGLAHTLADRAETQRLVTFANNPSASSASERTTAASPDPAR